MIEYDDRLSRSCLLMGDEGMEQLRQTKVIIFGVGGVGSWCAESLVRTGLTHLTIVDGDTVCASNINRQLMATMETVGSVKVEVLRQRLLSINPDAQITARHELFNESSVASFELESYDIIIDAIDSLNDKASLILHSCRTKASLFSSMGAALKMDPRKVSVTEFWKVKGCPLARALRQLFKKRGERPARKFLCVYSEELLTNKGEVSPSVADHKRVNGSLMHITALFGLTLAGLVVQHIYESVHSAHR